MLVCFSAFNWRTLCSCVCFPHPCILPAPSSLPAASCVVLFRSAAPSLLPRLLSVSVTILHIKHITETASPQSNSLNQFRLTTASNHSIQPNPLNQTQPTMWSPLTISVALITITFFCIRFRITLLLLPIYAGVFIMWIIQLFTSPQPLPQQPLFTPPTTRIRASYTPFYPPSFFIDDDDYDEYY
jgi:hypothetical protein